MYTRPLISITVPIYNAEKYLRKSLDSLLNQTLRDIEIVLVNDGSTDLSESICKEYAKRDSRIVLISKENGGSASARQAALDVSQGLYICSCDADDWVEKDMYESLYQKAIESNADIIMCDYWYEYPDGKHIEYKYSYDIKNRKDLLDDALNKRFPCMVWNKIIKRDIFSNNNLSWEKGIDMGEDFLMMLKILKSNVSVGYLPRTLYHYRRNIGGTSYTNNMTMAIYNQMLHTRQWITNNIDVNKYQNGMFVLWLDQAFAGLRVNESITPRNFRETALDKIPYSGFLKYDYPRFKGIIVLLSKIFGFRMGHYLVGVMYKYFYK